MKTEVWYGQAMEFSVDANDDDEEKDAKPQEKKRRSVDHDFEDRHKGAAETYRASAELDLEAQEIQREHPSLSYEQCLVRARRDNPTLSEQAFPKKGL
jgi:hypothetical protein